MIKLYKKLKKTFYEGPDWTSLPSFIKGKNYRSPTVLMILWLYAWVLRIFTFPGRIIIPASLLLLSYSLIIIQNPIRIFAFGLVAIILTDIILGFIFKPRKLFLSREIPERTTRAVPFEVFYEVKNEGRLPLWNICLDPFAYFNEKSEEIHTGLIPHLAPGEKISFSTKRIAPKRGAFNIYTPVIETIFPFSIFKWSKRGGKSAKIIVHPDFEPITNIFFPPGQNYQIEGNTQVSKTGDSNDFIGCREFRTGDNPRHIHWASTARRGELVVKEFQEEYLTRVAIIADLFISPQVGVLSDIFGKRKSAEEKKFEALVNLCAAIVDNISRGEYLLDIFIAGRDVYHLGGGRSRRKFEYLLDVISCMESDRLEPVSELSKDILEILQGIGSVMLILLEWDEPRIRLWRQLSEAGVQVKTIIISKASDKIPASFTLCSEEMILNGKLKFL